MPPVSIIISVLLVTIATFSTIASSDSASAIAELDTIIVKSRRRQATEKFATTSVTTFDQSILLNMPGTANDLNRVIAVHPSVLSIGAYNNNALYVRGGNPTENVYLVDGMPFDDINHYPLLNRPGGGFGFLDPDMIDKLEIYAGGIPADLPTRTSSAIDITLRDGATDHPAYRADFSIMGFGLAGEGPLPKSSGSYLLSMRFADMRLMQKLYEEIGPPRYGDGLFKCGFDLKKGGTLLLHAIGSFDYYKGVSGEPAQGFMIENYNRLRSNVEAGGLSWKKTFPLLSSELQFSVSRTEHERSRIYTGSGDTLVLDSVYRSNYYRNQWQDSILMRYAIEKTQLIGDRIYTWGVRKKNLYANWHIFLPLGEHVDAVTGVSGELHRLHLHNQYGIEGYSCYYYTAADSVSTVPTDVCQSVGSYDYYTVVDGLQAGGYLQVLAQIGPVSVAPGIRADYYALIDRGGLSPRLSISFENDLLGTFAASGSMIRQLPTDFDRILNSLLGFGRASDESTAVELDDLKLQRCLQGTIAWRRRLCRSHSIGAEAYIKRYDQQYELIEPDCRNIDTYNTYDYSGDRHLLRIGPPHGKQRVYGVEATITNERKSRLFYSGAFSYSVSRHMYTDGSWHTDKFGKCKKASLLAGFSFSKEHVVTASLLAMTGRLYGTLDSVQYRPYESFRIERLSEQLPPVYHLSARYTFECRFRRLTVGAYLEAINILNRKQVIDREDYGYGYEDQRIVGILPNAAILVAF